MRVATQSVSVGWNRFALGEVPGVLLARSVYELSMRVPVSLETEKMWSSHGPPLVAAIDVESEHPGIALQSLHTAPPEALEFHQMPLSPTVPKTSRTPGPSVIT